VAKKLLNKLSVWIFPTICTMHP